MIKQVYSPIGILISLVTALQVMAAPLPPKDYMAIARPIRAMPYQLGAKKRDLTDVSIGGIKIGMTLQQVTNKLGKPTKTSQITTVHFSIKMLKIIFISSAIQRIDSLMIT